MTEFLAVDNIQSLPAFATSLAIGLLVGLERERNPSNRAGLRTFALVTLLGTLLALLSEQSGSWLLAAGLLLVGAMIIGVYRSKKPEEDSGATTQAALILCFGLGAAVWYGYATLAIMLAITTTLLLHFKPELQNVTRSLSRNDIQSMLQFAVLSFIVLPILPDHDFGPYETLNPAQTWWMVVLISGVSLAGYVALRVVGQRFGVPLLGFFGGMVSSTATTLIYARHGRAVGMRNLAVVVITIANLVVLVRLGVVSGTVAPQVLPQLLPVLVSGLLCGGVATLYLWRRMSTDGEELPMPEVRNPTEIKAAVSFGLLYAVVLLAAAWLSDIAGDRGLYLLAFASGLTDVDAISLSSLRLLHQGKLDTGQVVNAIGIAYCSNLIFKFGMLSFIGGRELAQKALLGMGAVGLGVAAGLLV
jgi:uncharacterized membrane protein (DUF4010 family)